MSTYIADVLVLGATGFTGRLITKYLLSHPERSQFTFAIAGRSSKRLRSLVSELGLHADIPVLEIDLSASESKLDEVVDKFKVVINTIGPYCKWGTPVVLACGRAGTHYVDLAGEVSWIKKIIEELGDVPSRTGSLIVPACGFDCVPSDLGAFLSVRALQSAFDPKIHVGRSTTAHEMNPGVKYGCSKGSLFTAFAMFEDIPRSELFASMKAYYLSPVQGAPRAPLKLWYTLPLPRNPIHGAYFPLSSTNISIVERTWGLLQLRKGQNANAHSEDISYGNQFIYTEFIKVSSPWLAIPSSLFFMALIFLLMFCPPVRWFLKAIFPETVEEHLSAGNSESINLTEGTLSENYSSPKYAKSTIIIKADPGYIGASVIISECALGLLLTPRSQLPKGDILTPVAALGNVLADRLNATAIIEARSEVLTTLSSLKYD